MRRKKPLKTIKQTPESLCLPKRSTESEAEALAHAALRPALQAALTVTPYYKDLGQLSVNTLVADLETQCASANRGDLLRSEALLVAHAHTLDALFKPLLVAPR